MIEFDIPQIDLVIVDLYLWKTVASGASEADIIEKSILRYFFNSRCCKNFKDTVIASVDQYSLLLIYYNPKRSTTLENRKLLAKSISCFFSLWRCHFNYFNDETIYKESIADGQVLNMVKIHIKRLFFGDFDAMFKKIHGKELSYNNLLCRCCGKFNCWI
jgi:phosphoribosylaminoimidazolecarboxamide formyltransferase/IMP cyclohydrolase